MDAKSSRRNFIRVYSDDAKGRDSELVATGMGSNTRLYFSLIKSRLAVKSADASVGEEPK